jgi:hypothetical protein
MSKYLQAMRAGDDYNLKLTVTAINTLPVDITGYKFYFTVKSSFDETDLNAVLQFSTTAGDNPNDDIPNGVCYLSVPAALTKVIPQGKYFWDIQQTVGTKITTLLPPPVDFEDLLIVVPEVTKAL